MFQGLVKNTKKRMTRICQKERGKRKQPSLRKIESQQVAVEEKTKKNGYEEYDPKKGRQGTN